MRGVPEQQAVAEMRIFLETERLVLRQFTEDDLDNLFDLDGDPDVMRFINGGRPTPLVQVRHEILPTYLRPSRIPGFGTWVALERSSGGFLGWFGFRPPKDGSTDDPELGFRLRKSGWGKGYATEGFARSYPKGFSEYSVRRVFAMTMTVDIASRRVMEKAGLKFVRTLVLDWPDYVEGAEHGGVEYALYREEWESSRRLALG